MRKYIQVLDDYFQNCENRSACHAYDCMRKELVGGQKPSTNSGYTAALENILLWLDGQRGSFPDRKDGQGMCWWRIETMKRLNAAKKRHGI